MWRIDDAGSSKKGYIMEGNIPILIFRTDPIRVRFLVKLFDRKPFVKQGLTDEGIDDLLYSKKLYEDWYAPIPVWEHAFINEGGKFQTAHCTGRDCKYCLTNQTYLEKNPKTENRLLPRPIRKRYLLPVWVYDLEKVLFVKQSGDFFKSIDTYLSKFGIASDFEVFKEGRGLDTHYMATYLGQSKKKAIDVKVMLPSTVDLTPIEEKDFGDFAEEDDTPEEIEEAEIEIKKPKSKSSKSSQGGSGVPEKKNSGEAKKKSPADFIITFGDHKGKTIRTVYAAGHVDFIKFLKNNGTGDVRKAAAEFLKTVK